MSRRLISTGSPFEATAGYSRAVADRDFCFVAGTTGYDYDTMRMPASVEEQTRNCLRTIAASLAKAGFEPADVVRATYYVVERADAPTILTICGEFFREIRPAATLLVVAGLLAPEMRVEIEVTALRRATSAGAERWTSGRTRRARAASRRARSRATTRSVTQI